MSIINDPWGVIFIGCFISVALFGIVVVQTYTYFERFPNDKPWIKAFIAVLFLIDVLTTIFAIWLMYYMFIDNWGDMKPFTYSNWLLAVDPLFAAIMAFMVQIFFGWRIHVITSNKILTFIILVLSLATLLGGVGVCIGALIVVEYIRFGTLQAVAIVWLISAAVCDLLIAFVLTYHLKKHQGSFKKTDRFINKIVRLTIQNGMLTALVALADISMYLATPMPYHIALSFLMPKLYSNTALSSLNSRSSRNNEWDHSPSTDPGRADHTNVTNTFIRGKTESRRQGVFVSIETHEMADVPSSDKKVTTGSWEDDRPHDSSLA